MNNHERSETREAWNETDGALEALIEGIVGTEDVHMMMVLYRALAEYWKKMVTYTKEQSVAYATIGRCIPRPSLINDLLELDLPWLNVAIREAINYAILNKAEGLEQEASKARQKAERLGR